MNNIDTIDTPETIKDADLFKLVPRVMKTSGKKSRLFYCGLLLRFIERLLSLAPFFVIYFWFYSAITHSNEDSLTGLITTDLIILLITLVILLGAQVACSYWGQLLCFLSSYNIMSGYREKIISKIQKLPINTLQQQHSGKVAEVLTDDIKNVENIFTHITADLITALVTPLVFFIGLAFIDWRLALSLTVTFPVAIIILQKTRKLLLQLGLRKQNQNRETAGLLVEFISGITSFRLFNTESLWVRKLEQQFSAIRKNSMDLEAFGAGPVLLYRLCIELGLVIFLIAGALLSGNGTLNNLYWLLFIILAYKLVDPLLDAAAYLTILRLAAQSEQHIQLLLNQPVIPEPATPTQLPGNFSITFDNVSFSYADPSRRQIQDANWRLRNISFHLEHGHFLAIVGTSGAGKSTIAHLIARFFDPIEGRVLLGGIDLRELGTEKLYEYLSIVFQDVQLFDGTIMENVRIGKPGASDTEVIDACERAICGDFIQSLSHSYQTLIGEGGQNLSGGERQRLSIARAMLRNAPVLLLDEATASVDPETQYEIQTALSRLAKNKTVIMIAHRLNTIRHANQILVLNQGALAEQGTHENLLNNNGHYARLWMTQNVT